MKLENIRKLCLSLPGTTEEILWEKDLVFKVAGKMFLCMGMEESSSYSFKCSPEAFNELVGLPGVKPAPYLARAKWVQIEPELSRMRPKEIEKLIRTSYDLVVSRLSKKARAALHLKK